MMGPEPFIRNITRENPVALLLLATLLFALPARAASAQQPGQAPAGGVAASQPRFRVVRSVSGTKGVQEGSRYIIQDPRTIFRLPDDKQVIVYFEWEGPTGMHTFEGYWKNPEGKVAAISDFKFEAKEKRFGAFWTFLLSEQMPTGLWTLDARIDGETAGTHTFQILAAEGLAEASQPPPRRTLTAAEIYELGLRSTVTIEKIGGNGEKMGVGSGFILQENRVVTAFEVIDGGSSARVTLPDGRRVVTDQVLAWNRKQNWAVLHAPGVAGQALQRRKTEWSVGERCFGLDTAVGGNRVIAEASVIGRQSLPVGGERISVGLLLGRASSGGPILDEYGDVLALVGPSVVPGTVSLSGTRFEYSTYGAKVGEIIRGSLAVPVSLVPAVPAQTAPTAFDELHRRGEFISPLTASGHVFYGVLGARLIQRGSFPEAEDQKFEYTRREGQVAILVSWQPKSKMKSTTTIRLYDTDNHALAETRPSKINLDPERMAYTTWEMSIRDLSPGIYRLDLLLGDEPAWRAFFRVTE
jgi:S1-C subfamily serine protease